MYFKAFDKLSFSKLLKNSKVRFIVHIFCYAIKYRNGLNLYRKIPVKTIKFNLIVMEITRASDIT